MPPCSFRFKARALSIMAHPKRLRISVSLLGRELAGIPWDPEASGDLTSTFITLAPS